MVASDLDLRTEAEAEAVAELALVTVPVSVSCPAGPDERCPYWSHCTCTCRVRPTQLGFAPMQLEQLFRLGELYLTAVIGQLWIEECSKHWLRCSARFSTLPSDPGRLGVTRYRLCQTAEHRAFGCRRTCEDRSRYAGRRGPGPSLTGGRPDLDATREDFGRLPLRLS